MIKDRNIADDAQISISKILGAGFVAAGEVFWVANSGSSGNTYYNWIRSRVPADHMFTDIQKALDATVANRNDYVIVLPSTSDYDLTAALTMSKARTHLVAPSGYGEKGMSSNSVRVHQNTAATACITISADVCEVAGLFFKGVSGGNIIDISGTNWHTHIHDNFFGLSATASSNNYAIYGAGAVSHPSIHDNFFTNYSPGAVTGTDNDVAAFIGLTSASSTRGLICDNLFTSGVNTAVAAAISVAGLEFFITRNQLFESPAFGSSQTGTLTLGISTSTGCFVTDNRIGIGTPANGVNGGTANVSYVTNYEATSGGTLLT